MAADYVYCDCCASVNIKPLHSLEGRKISFAVQSKVVLKNGYVQIVFSSWAVDVHFGLNPISTGRRIYLQFSWQ